jgi:pSer/pThr/pTyr-binding forkhead associated (FHA) protein
MSGPAAGRSVEVDRELVIGRESVDVLIDDPEISRRHALIRPVETGVAIQDLGSTNGTFVDGKRVDAATVTSGSTIRLGKTEIDVEIHVPVPPEPEPAAPVQPAERPAPSPAPPPRPARGSVRRLD